MLIHMVLLRFDDDTHADEAVRRLRDLPAEIDVIRRLVAGRNVVPSDRAYEVGLLVELDGVEGLEIYRDHPAHVAVAEFIRAHRSAVAACDVEQ